MSQFSAFINLELPAHGEYVNNWEIPANANFVKIDALFHGTGSNQPNGSGHIHDGSDGEGPRIDHADLLASSIGTNTHAQIDTHIADGTVHFLTTDVDIAVNDNDFAGSGATASFPDAAWNNGPNGEDLVRELRFPNALSITSPSAGVVVIDTGAPGTGGPPGVPSHLPTTFAPVAVTDYFNGLDGQPLSTSNWFVTAPQGVELLTNQEAATLSQDLTQGGVASGLVINRVMCQIPHSEVQRVTFHVCRVGTDDFVTNTDTFTFQLALMSSVFEGQNTISRLGFFFKVDVFKVGTAIHMTRTLYAVPSVGGSGSGSGQGSGPGNVTVLWTDTGPVTDFRHYVGCHEFSLDRNHAFHYLYNNGPVNLGTAGNAQAATPFVATLSASLLQEFTQFPQTAGALGVAPQFGRFGFDCQWSIPAGGGVDASFQFFTATSTDDETLFYSTVKKPADCGAIPPQPMPMPCCLPTSLHPNVEVGSIIQADPVSGAASPNPVDYTVVQCIPDQDPTYCFQGFLIKRTGHENDPMEPTYFICCDAPANVTSRVVVAPRPCTKDVKIEICGDCLPGLINVPVFRPADPTVPTPTPVPPGSGSHPQPFPYPVAGCPGELVSGGPVTAAGIWPTSVDLDSQVFSNIRYHYDVATKYLVIEFDVGDGLPYGACADIIITSLVNSSNTFTVPSAVCLHPPEPLWTAVRYYGRNPDGTWFEFDPTVGIPECGRIYIIACGKRLPLPIVKANDPTGAQTLWAGFPFDPLSVGLNEKYQIIDEATGADATGPGGITVHSMRVYKGWFDIPPPSLPPVITPPPGTPTTGFPPVNVTPVNQLGETLFAEIEFPIGAAGSNYVLRAVETADPSTAVADSPFPTVTAVAPQVDAVDIQPDALVGNGKTIIFTGDWFDTPTTTTPTPTLIGNIAVVNNTSQTQLEITCDFLATGTGTFTITNQNGASVDVSVLIGAGSTPTIVSVTPNQVTAATPGVAFTVQGTNFDPGATIAISPNINPQSVVLDDVNDTFTLVGDIPSVAGSNLAFQVTNPNSNQSNVFNVAVNAPGKPCVLNLEFYENEANLLAAIPNPQGREIGASGIMQITGGVFRAGDVVSVNVPQFVQLGAATVVSGTEIRVNYAIALGTPIGTQVDVTVTDPDGVTSDTNSFNVEEHTPVITTVNVTNPHEGAGHAGLPVGDLSARVLISGQFFFNAGVSNISSVTVTTGNGTANDVTVVSDNLIQIDRLQINSGTSGQTLTIRVTALGGKTADYSFVIQPAVIPIIPGWTVHPSSGAPALMPIVVQPGATNHVVKLFGTNLVTLVTSATLTGPFVGSPSATITPSEITLTLPTIDNPVTGDPTVRAVLDVAGTSTQLVIDLFQVDSSIAGSPTVTSVDEFAVIEGTEAGIIVINGTNLGPNQVREVRLVANDGTKLPLSVAPTTAIRPISAVITNHTATAITAQLNVANDLATDGLDFRVKLFDPSASELTIAAFDVTVQPFPDRPKFQAPLPAISTPQGTFNDITYTLTSANGGETLEVFNGQNVVPVSTGNPLQLRVQFNMPATAGTPLEVRLIASNGAILDHQTVVTSV